MEKKENKKTQGREELKKYFRNGRIPSENHFGYLIDSMINRQDDGFSKDEEYGLHISPMESSRRLITFYSSIDELQPFFFVEKSNGEIPGLKLQPDKKSGEPGTEDGDSFFFHEGGRLGVGKKCSPDYKLDVKGFAGMEGRLGTFRGGTIPADGSWHSVVENLDNCQAFEVVARTGNKGKGKFAILHAVALSAYGRSRSKIRKTSAYYGFFWNRLNLRWKGEGTHRYHLQLRSNSNYGPGVMIYYTITKLWDDEHILPPDAFYSRKS